MTWGKARKKPITIEYREVNPSRTTNLEAIQTPEGTMYGYKPADYIIRGIQGELYPIKKDIFYETYDVIEEHQSSNQRAIK